MNKEIPLIYKILLRKLWEKSDFGKLRFREARIILSTSFRLGKQNTIALLRVMKEEGYLECKSSQFVVVLVPLNDLV